MGERDAQTSNRVAFQGTEQHAWHGCWLRGEATNQHAWHDCWLRGEAAKREKSVTRTHTHTLAFRIPLVQPVFQLVCSVAFGRQMGRPHVLRNRQSEL
eukprot:1156904-Pelagomonas_calceolata.AAC.3